MSKLFSEAECLAIFEGVTSHPVCSPPVAKTETAQGLAALAVSGQVGGSSWINAEQAAIRAISASLLPIPVFSPLQTCAEFREAVTLRAESAALDCGERKAERAAAGLCEANPDGNHGDNKTLATVSALECI